MWWDELPVAAFCCQEILDPRHLGWMLKRVVPPGADWTPWTLVPMSEWMTLSLPRRVMKCLKSSKKCLSGETCDNFNVDSLCHRTNKYGDVALGCLLAVCGSQL